MKRWFLAATFVALAAQSAYAQTVRPVSIRIQERTNWCWAAASQSMLDAYGVTVSQTNIASFGTPGSADISNWLTGETFNPHRRGIDRILSNFGQLQNAYVASSISMSECRTEVNSARPFVIAYQWGGGGGHAFIGTHCDPLSNTLTVMDPAFGMRVVNFSQFTSAPNGDRWTETLKVSAPIVPPATPQLLGVAAGICDVQVHWSRPVANGSLVDQIERRVVGGQWALVHSTGGGGAGITFSTLRNQLCSTPNGVQLEYRVRTWNQTGNTPAHFSAYSATGSVVLYDVPDLNAHPEVALQVTNVPAGLRASWGPHWWWKVEIERRPENGSWVQVAELVGQQPQLAGFIDYLVPENQRHFYRYRAAMNSFGVVKYSNWANEKPGIRTGTRGGLIVSDTNSGLALNAYGGAQHLGELRLVNNCTIANPDCTWTYRNGMLRSDKDATLAINAFNGARNLGELRLVNNCTSSNPDCTWTLKDGMFISDRDPTLVINAFNGAIHGTTPRLVNYCTSSNSDCTFTYKDVSISPTTSRERLAMRPIGAVVPGALLEVVNDCAFGSPECTWTISRGRISSRADRSLFVAVDMDNAITTPRFVTTAPLVLSDCSGRNGCNFTLTKGMVVSDLPSALGVNATGGALHGARLKAVSTCTSTLLSCTFTERGVP